MVTLIQHKRVEFSELFYDPVFVFAISKATALIHPLHGGVVVWDSLLDFFISVTAITNSWMIQAIYTNRCETNSLFNTVIMFINMGLVFFIPNMIGYNWQQWYYHTCWAVGTLTLTLFFRYLIQFFRRLTDNANRENVKGFLRLTGLQCLGVYLAVLFPIHAGVYVFIASILLTFTAPIFLITRDERFQVNLPHLIERVSFLVIITFGEMVIGLISFFTAENFSIYSVLNFVIMLSLFLFYFGESNHVIDEGSSQKGLFVIYSHYPIFIGPMLMTVSMGYLLNPKANLLVAISLPYIGTGLFQAAVLVNGPYNKNYLRYLRSYYNAQATLYLAALILFLLLASNPITVLSTAAIFTLAIVSHFISFWVTRAKQCSVPYRRFF